MWRSAVAVSAFAVALFVVAFCVGRVAQANLLAAAAVVAAFYLGVWLTKRRL